MRKATAFSRNRNGFTLVEVMVSLAVFMLVTVISASTLTRLTSFYTESIYRSGLMEAAKVAQESLLDELRSAKVLSVTTAGGYPAVTFVVPVMLPNGTTTDYFDSSGSINWGCQEASGPQRDSTGSPHRVTLSALATSTITEQKAKRDVNNDGDFSDSFQLGSLVLTTSGGMKRTLISQRLVLSEVGKSVFDMNKDLTPDPLLKINGEPFTDTNLNGVYDSSEAFTDLNKNGYWDGSLTLNLLSLGTDRDGQGHTFYYQANLWLTNN